MYIVINMYKRTVAFVTATIAVLVCILRMYVHFIPQ